MTLLYAALGTFWTGSVLVALLDGRRRSVGLLALVLLAAGTVLLALLAASVWRDGTVVAVAGGWPQDVGITLRADAFGVLFALLSAVVLLSALAHEVAAGVRSRVMPALVLFLATGLTGLFLTGDVFSFYVFFELAMIAAYSLTAYGEKPRQLGAAFIFAIVNLLGSFLFLISIGALYRVTGTLGMAAAAERFASVDPTTALLIAIGFFVAFGVKLGLFPFHFWLPAVYAGVRPAVAAILAGALANIGTYGLLRFGTEILAAEVELAATMLIVLGIGSVLYGSMQALSRRTIREVLAYSSIGQIGYVLVAIGLGGTVGIGAAVLYAVVNALNKALLFLSADIRGWLVGAAFFVGALSVAGVPPAAGFLSKAAVLGAGVETDEVAVVALLVLGAALSFVYLFQIYQHAYWKKLQPVGAPIALRAPALVLCALVLGGGLWPEPLLAAAGAGAEALTGDPGGAVLSGSAR